MTEAFERLARSLAKSGGLPDLPLLVMPTALSYLSPPAVLRACDDRLPALVDSLARPVERVDVPRS